MGALLRVRALGCPQSFRLAGEDNLSLVPVAIDAAPKRLLALSRSAAAFFEASPSNVSCFIQFSVMPGSKSVRHPELQVRRLGSRRYSRRLVTVIRSPSLG